MKILKIRSGMLVCMIFFIFCFLPINTGYSGPNEFSAAFYEANGVNPNMIGFMPTHSGFGQEINLLTGGFDNAGNIIFYTANSAVWADSFTNDAAGGEAFETAEQFVAWIFPKKGGNPLSPMFSNRRQDNIFDTRGGYFSNNPLGLWRLEFIQWFSDDEIVDPNVRESCSKLREGLLEENGPSLDGVDSPIFTTSSQVRNAISKGCVSFQSNTAVNKGQGMFRWVA